MGNRGQNATPEKWAEQVLEEARERRLPWQEPGLSRAERVCTFIEGLTLTSGSSAGQKFMLRPWQRSIIEGIYRVDENGRRIVRRVLITMPRKNGKTQLTAALALAHLCGPESESRGEVYSAAVDRDQASRIWDEIMAFRACDEYLKARLLPRFHVKEMTDRETRSTYKVMSSDARKAHSLNVSFAVLDECAQWRGRAMYDNLRTGVGARAEPLIVMISTKSSDPNHFFSEMIRHGERVRDGEIEDPKFYPVLYAADEKADPWSEETWKSCNPALGDFRNLDELRSEAEMAKISPSQEPAFRLLYLNQPVDATRRFINRVDWEACKARIDVTALYGKRCILGLDLSATTDLTALAAFFPESGDLLTWFWLPEDQLGEAERRDHVPYTLWKRQGLLETTRGRAIDKATIVRRVAEIASDFRVEAMAYDRYGTKDLFRIMDDEGVRIGLVDWGQGYQDMTPAIAAFEIAVLNKTLRHPSHPIMTWCLSNTKIQTDPTLGRKPNKEKSTGRIDGLVAASMAVGLAARTAPAKPSVYNSRGLRTLKAPD